MKSAGTVLVIFLSLPIIINSDNSKSDWLGINALSPREKIKPGIIEDHDYDTEKVFCDLPDHPKNGFYVIREKDSKIVSYLTYFVTHIEYFCNSGYDLVGSNKVYCNEGGSWNSSFPECVAKYNCSLSRHDSVEYLCSSNNNFTSANDVHECGEFVTDGTEVQPKCREPDFYYPGSFKNMYCLNGIWDSFIICYAKTTVTISSTIATTTSSSNTCLLPEFPKDGHYTIVEYTKNSDFLHLNYFCKSGYKLEGSQSRFCSDGWWTSTAPNCTSQSPCLLNKHSSIQYLCLSKNSQYEECEEIVEAGAVVKSVCRENYFYSDILLNMHCRNGEWDIVNFCYPNCGLVTPRGEPLIVGGHNASRGELPWYTGIYRKNDNTYKQICGGSLVSRAVIISAAHCFWNKNEGIQYPASNYAAAVGKIYRMWDDPRDEVAQKSEVRDVKIPPRFRGPATNFQDDIAVVIVQTAFEYRTHIRPICIDFDLTFNRRQLHVNALGKVAGWGITNNGMESPILQVVELPYVEFNTCFNKSSPAFHKFITRDKICAGAIDGTARAVCKGDSGAGLAFQATDRDVVRHYLRGVTSTVQSSDDSSPCNVHVYATFTQVIQHEEFLKEHL